MASDPDDLPQVNSPLIIIAGEPRMEEWIACAHRYGQWVPMHPRHFPVCGSRNECLDRVRIKLGTDPAFKRRWWGWSFVAVRYDDAVLNR